MGPGGAPPGTSLPAQEDADGARHAAGIVQNLHVQAAALRLEFPLPVETRITPFQLNPRYNTTLMF